MIRFLFIASCFCLLLVSVSVTPSQARVAMYDENYMPMPAPEETQEASEEGAEDLQLSDMAYVEEPQALIPTETQNVYVPTPFYETPIFISLIVFIALILGLVLFLRLRQKK